MKSWFSKDRADKRPINECVPRAGRNAGPAFVENWSLFLGMLIRGLDVIFAPGEKTDDEHWESRSRYSRAALYEQTFFENFRLLFRFIPGRKLLRARKDEKAFLRLIEGMRADDPLPLFEINQPFQVTPDMGVVSLVMQGHYRAFVAFGQTMAELLGAASNGSDESLFRAVRIDPCVLGGPTAYKRITHAVGMGDRTFFKRLAEALRDPGKLEDGQHSRFNAALRFMALAGALEFLTPQTAYEIFVKETRLYRQHGSVDPKKSLWRKVQRFKKEHATKFPGKMSPTAH